MYTHQLAFVVAYFNILSPRGRKQNDAIKNPGFEICAQQAPRPLGLTCHSAACLS